MTKKIGVFSGTFDPVHKGHIAFCLAALQTCGLDQVVIIPERHPRGKQNVSDLARRLALLERAVRPYTPLRVMTLDSDQLTVKHSLPELERRFPQAELSLLVGSDVVQTFSSRWEGLEQLLAAMPLIVGLRAGDSARAVTTLLRQLETTLACPVRFSLLDSPHPALASSQIRAARARAEAE